MADAPGAATVPSHGADFFEHIEDVDVKILQRVAATKPLSQLFKLVGLKEATNDYDAIKAPPEAEEDRVGVVQVYAVTKPRMLGLRIALRMEDSKNLVAVLGGVEYRWARHITYSRPAVEDFLLTEAAPRLIVSVWTVMVEVGRSVGVDLDSMPPISPELIVTAVHHQFDEHPDRQPEW